MAVLVVPSRNFITDMQDDMDVDLTDPVLEEENKELENKN